MEEWKRLEFEYAKRLRECAPTERRRLYAEAYDNVMSLVTDSYESMEPERRTAGTTLNIISAIARIAQRTHDLLEVGCGRGYTCIKLAPHVRSIVGTDVAQPVVDEARALVAESGVENVSIEQVSGLDLTGHFSPESFDVAVSIDVVEHLHPDDAREHLAQVLRLLRPGGRYVIFMPSSLNGPHDITAQEFPDAKRALGFHLNESTYRDMAREMKRVGFTSLKSIVWTKRDDGVLDRLVTFPVGMSRLIESAYAILPQTFRTSLLDRFVQIRLMGMKPRVLAESGDRAPATAGANRPH